MKDKSYPYDQTQGSRYTFTSVGKKRIVKQVIFTPTGIRNIINMGFGDIMPDGSIDDTANSNNGDTYSQLPFEPKADLKFIGFLIQRIH
jgi:hypothetical protein